MTLAYLDHVTIHTADLTGLSRFYRDVLGLEDGPRPAFRFAGAWLYCGDRAALHLVEVESQPNGGRPRIEHFAFRAAELSVFLERLRDHQVGYRVAVVPGSGNKQVHLFDPDRNHVEIQFAADEEADMTAFPGAGDQAVSKA